MPQKKPITKSPMEIRKDYEKRAKKVAKSGTNYSMTMMGGINPTREKNTDNKL